MITNTNDILFQIIYVSLSTKGKFYETSSSLPAPGKQSNFDKDCVHRLPNILQHCDLPVNVKLISGPLPDCMSQDCSGNNNRNIIERGLANDYSGFHTRFLILLSRYKVIKVDFYLGL